MADFTFPVLAVTAVTADNTPAPLPLTARSTVVDRSTQTAPPVVIAPPVQPTAKAPRSKDDEYLTHLLYSFLNKYFGVPYRVPLEKGYSQVDWLRLTRGSADLNTLGRGAPLRTDITLAEVRQHRTAEDAWMVLSGKVYNITPYLKFHPGGVDILLKAAGKDGTALFQKYHPWVNADALLEKCLIGKLAVAAAVASPVGGTAVAPEPQPQQLV